MKKIKLISYFLIASILFASFPILASAAVANTVVSVTPVVQAKTNWCWAAGAEMAGKQAYSSATRTQYNIVNYLKGTTSNPHSNVSGSIADSANGSKYVTNNTKTFTATASKWTWAQIQTRLKANKAVQAGAGYYSGSTRNGGHIVVIYGTQFIDNDSGTQYKINYVDPANGVRYTCLYSAFCDGTFNSRKYDQTIYY